MERLVGGLEVVRELHDRGELKKLLEWRPAKKLSSIGDKFKSRFKSNKDVYQTELDIPAAD